MSRSVFLTLTETTHDHVAALATQHGDSWASVARTFVLNGLDDPDRFLPDAYVRTRRAIAEKGVETALHLSPELLRRASDLAWNRRMPLGAMVRLFLEGNCKEHPVPPEEVERHRVFRTTKMEKKGIEPSTSALLLAPNRDRAAGDLDVSSEDAASDATAQKVTPVQRARSRSRKPHPHGVKRDRYSRTAE